MPGTASEHRNESVIERALLTDGTAVMLRVLEVRDRAAIHALFEGLSDDSRYRRFQTVSRRLAPGLLGMLCAMDGESHVAVGAFRSRELIGVARYVRSQPGSPEAEFAFTVADAYQGRGLGRHLLYTLARLAHARGVFRFRFTVLADNGPASHLLLGPGAPGAPGPWQRDGSLEVAEVLVHPRPMPRVSPDAPAATASMPTGVSGEAAA